MLHYIYDVTLQLFISVTLITLFFALCKTLAGRTGTLIMLGGTIVGLLAATYRAVRHAFLLTRDAEINLYTFYVGFIAMALMLLALILFCRRRAPGWGKIAVCALAALVSADLLFYKAWKVIWAPAEFETAGEGILSAAFFTRLAGWALALILFAVYSRFLYRCLMRLDADPAIWTDRNGDSKRNWSHPLLGGASALSLMLVLTNFSGQILRAWRQKTTVRRLVEGRRALITSYKFRPSWFPVPEANSPYDQWERNFAMEVGNNPRTFIIIAGAIVLTPLAVLFVRSLLQRGRYSNPAQKRRLCANRRHNRRWVTVVAVCFVIAILNLTLVYALDNRTEAEPVPETYTISEDGTEVRIPIEQVNDFNLHAFSIITENNVEVRWIVIRKPGSGAYGVGLNACDVCGPAGYIQREDTVVCVKCDVVMNTNTIGLPGGCNPVPLAFSIKDGNLVIQMADLIKAEARFKNR
ncbi:MAG: DUF2318 domain-containing protein [Clostridia bacterium]|nr:DUF2318 domain-containing protein [Clostridia bacterium]